MQAIGAASHTNLPQCEGSRHRLRLALETLYKASRIFACGVAVLGNLSKRVIKDLLDVRWNECARRLEVTDKRGKNRKRGIRNAHSSGPLRCKDVHAVPLCAAALHGNLLPQRIWGKARLRSRTSDRFGSVTD